MFFKKQEKLDLLYEKNIKVNCKAANKDEVIKTVGQMLVDTGYVKANYIDGMLEREKTYSTFMGSGLAIPHGVEAAKKEVKQSGIAVMVFPEGTDWDGESVNVVIGIAGVGDEHLDILAQIADKMLSEESVKEILSSDAKGVYEILTKE